MTKITAARQFGAAVGSTRERGSHCQGWLSRTGRADLARGIQKRRHHCRARTAGWSARDLFEVVEEPGVGRSLRPRRMRWEFRGGAR